VVPDKEVGALKKRFALIVAGGLVAVLIAASAALSLGLLGASSAARGDRTAPRVRTIHRTVTVHKKAKPAGQTVMLAAGSGSVAPLAGGESESEFEGGEGSSGEGHEYEVFDD
jgi:uncharacterized membrane protein YgcG